MDLAYTAKMESELDHVEENTENWVDVLRRFYGPFERELEEAEKKLPKVELRDEPTDELCPNCGKPMVIKTGRFGRFISCTGYPECKTTKPILKETGALCPKDGGKIVERKSRRGRTFYGCANYPACDFVSWDRVVPRAVSRLRRVRRRQVEARRDAARMQPRSGARYERNPDAETHRKRSKHSGAGLHGHRTHGANGSRWVAFFRCGCLVR